MELLKNLFEGYPNLWGGGVAHSVLILSLVIAFGIMLGKIKISGISPSEMPDIFILPSIIPKAITSDRMSTECATPPPDRKSVV